MEAQSVLLNCCTLLTLLNPPAGVSLFFEKFEWCCGRGCIPAGLFQGFVCHLPVRGSSVLGIVLSMGFQILLNCSGSKFGEK